MENGKIQVAEWYLLESFESLGPVLSFVPDDDSVVFPKNTM